MGDLVYINKDESIASKHMVEGIRVKDLKKDVDFHVVSFLVLDHNYDLHSLGGYLNKRSNKLLSNVVGGLPVFVSSILAGKNIVGFGETDYPEVDNLVFYKMDEEIDIDLATEVGLGVVQYKGETYLYYPSATGDDMDAVGEMLRIKVYCQLKYPDEIDKKLQVSFIKVQNMIERVLKANVSGNMRKLRGILNRKL